jgi:hypothetical protein
MKKIILLLCLAASTKASFSQTDKGDFLVGGNLGFRTNSSSSNFNLTPNVGYFFARHFAAGANLTVNFEKEGNVKTTDLGIGPFMRYYIGESTFRPFLHASIGYLNSTYKYNDLKSTNNGFYTTLGLGYAAFISQSVAFEGLAAYNYTDVSHAGSSNGFSLNFGFQVYINRDRMSTLRKGRLQ